MSAVREVLAIPRSTAVPQAKPLAGGLVSGLVASLRCGGSLVWGLFGLAALYRTLKLWQYVPQFLVAGALLIVGIGAAGEERKSMARMDEMVFLDSRFSYAETVKRLKAAIRAQGMQVMFVDDQQATLRRMGVRSPGAAIIEFFNGEYTKRIFEIDHAAHMAIPLRIGIMEGGEHDPHSKATHVMYDKPSALFARWPGLEAVAKELDHVVEKIVATVAAESGRTMKGRGHGSTPEGMGKTGR